VRAPCVVEAPVDVEQHDASRLEGLRCRLLDERPGVRGDELDDPQVESLAVELHEQGEDDPEPDGCGDGQQQGRHERRDDGDLRGTEVRMMARTCPVRRDPMAATISTAASVGMATVPTTPRTPAG
jgi:hypothetical protein